MHVTALVESADHVCCRYRLRAYGDQFATDGHTLDCVSLPRGWLDRLRLFRAIGASDVVILQRKLLPTWQLRWLRACARRLIFDFDDAVFHRDSYAAAGLHCPRRRRRFVVTVRAADAVVGGNPWLAEQARLAGAAGPIRVIPSCVDPSNYPRSRHASGGDGVRLVWLGSSSTLRGLEGVTGLFDAIGAAVAGVRLKLVADRFATFGRLPVERCRWSGATEAADLAAADIGIAWNPDDDWSRGKCGLKVVQYMAAGLPVIANPVGVHVDLVRHGETGFLASTPGEWIDAIRRLAADPDLRRRMGVLGRWRVEGEFSVEAGGRRWRELLATLAAGRRAAG